MKNLKLFQASSNTEMPARSAYFFERPDAAQEAKGLKKPEGANLKERLESLDKSKKEKLKLGSKAELQRLSKSVKENDWEKTADKVHTLNEWHKREVGVAIEVGDNQYLLIHESQEAIQLILAEHVGKSVEELKAELTKLEVRYDANTYTKDKIPTAEPIAKLLEKRGKIKAKLSPEAVAAQAYNKDLEAISAGLKKKPEVASPTEILSAENTKYQLTLNKLYGKGKVPAEISLVFNLDGKIDVSKLNDTVYLKKKLDSVFRAGSTNEFQVKVREAQKSLDPNSTDFQSLEAVLAAFKVMDITYGNITGGSPEKRLARMEKSVKKLPGLKDFDAQKLFADTEKGVGVETDWQDFYNKSAKAETPEANSANKGKLASILDGGEVQMLRVDRKAHGGKDFEAFIDRMPGAALKNSLDVPQTVRGDSAYVYKYAELSGTQAEAAIANYRKNHPELEKAFAGLSPEEIAKSFQIAQVEIPNCENPAIVVKPSFKEKPVPAPVATKEDIECEEALKILKVFRNVPGGLGLIFRPMDWFTSDAERNYLADPAIVDMKGKVLRESEYLNASKRLDIVLDKRLGNKMDDVSGATKGLRSRSEFLAEKTKVGDTEVTNDIAAEKLMQDLGKKVREAGADKQGFAALDAKADATKEWREDMKKQGYSSRLIQLAEFMYQENFDAKGLHKSLKREEAAYALLKTRENWKETLAGNRSGKEKTPFDFSESKKQEKKNIGPLTFAQFAYEFPDAYEKMIPALIEAGVIKSKSEADSLSGKIVNEVLDESLYAEDKLDIRHPPEFVGDFVVIPPVKDGQVGLHRVSDDLIKEFLNVSSPAAHLMQIATAISGYMVYMKTGTGIPDNLPAQYRQKIDEIVKNGGDPKSIMGSTTFEEFERFIRTGNLDCGQSVVSVPLNEVRLTIPGWRMMEKWVGSAGNGECVGNAGTSGGTNPGDVGGGQI